MTTDGLLEQIRAGQAQEDALKKHWGSYRTKEVDQYVEKLLGRLRNMEAVYQERYEEMRTSLLAMTRERDEQSERVRALERELENTAQRCNAHLKEQGLVALPKEEYGRFQNMEAVYRKDVEGLTEKLRQLEQETEELHKELEEKKKVQLEAESKIEQFEQIHRQAQARAEECYQLNLRLEAQTRAAAEQKAQIEKTEALCMAQAEELVQMQAQYEMLEFQYRLAQEMNQQIAREKEHYEKEAVRWQERCDAERNALLQRCRGILRSQQLCMQRLQESFTASVRCMESLSDARVPHDTMEEAV
ncbi:MAG: hypothetical protein ACOYU3_05125 [Bacillota bacterium]